MKAIFKYQLSFPVYMRFAGLNSSQKPALTRSSSAGRSLISDLFQTYFRLLKMALNRLFEIGSSSISKKGQPADAIAY
jgi:hypothetical protein